LVSLVYKPDGVTGSIATANVAGSPYGITIAKGSLSSLSGYSFNLVDAGTLTVTPKALTITASNESKIYGDTANLGTTAFSQSGLVVANGDSISGVTLSSLGAAASAQVAGSPYAITASNAAGTGLSNYSISYVSGALTVTPRPITVTADNQSRAAGEANPPLTFGIGRLGLVNGDTLSGELATSANMTSSPGSYLITQGTLAASSNYALTYVGGILTVTPGNPKLPLILSIAQYQAPRTSPINFVQSNVTPGPLTAFTRTESNTNTTPSTSQTAANTDPNVTGGIGNQFPPSADGHVYKPISQYDPSQYASHTLPDHVDQAGLATILTIIARADGLEATPTPGQPTIDQFFDPANGTADWHGVGWQNPLVNKLTFAPEPHAAEPNADNARPLDDKADLGALLGKGPVILGNAGGTSWLLAVVITEDGIVADDPVTGLRVLLSYDSATRAIGPIGKVFDPASNKWIALGDAAKDGIAAIDDAKVTTLQAFAAAKYLTVALVK
jgi:hypothetical protein